MMNIDKHNEEHIKEAIKKAGLEHPSPDFAINVMQKITASEVTVAYKPIISVTGWIAMAATVLALVVCAFYISDESSLFSWLDSEKLSGYFTTEISDKISLSKNMMYGLFIAAAVILLQIPLLKSWHQKTLLKNAY